MIAAAYVMPSGPPTDGPDLAAGLGWYHWSNFAMARAERYPEAAHLATWGWSDRFDALEHELEQLPHDEDIDPDTAAVTAQILAAVRARPDGATEFRASDGEPGEAEAPARESIFREEGFTGTDSHGHHWQNGKQVKRDDSAPAGDRAAGPADLQPDDKAAIAADVDRAIASMPADQQPPKGLLDKVKGLALDAGVKAYSWAVKIGESKAGRLVAAAIDAVFDGPSDLAKFGYNPGNTSGTAQGASGVRDDVKNNLQDATGVGVSGHLVAKIAAVVLSKAIVWAKGKLRGEADETGTDTAEGITAWAEMISQLLAHLHEQLGAVGATPDAATVAAKLHELLGAK